MKPDGVATTPAEPEDDVVEPVPEAAASEEQVQQDLSPSSPQSEKPENEGEQEGAHATLPPPGKEVNGKFSKPKDKTKAPIKLKPGTSGAKATTTTSAVSRPATAQSRVTSGVMKTVSNGASKKSVSMPSEMKNTAHVGTTSQVKKVPTATTAPPKTQVKAAERKAVGSAKPAPCPSSGVKKTAAATSTLSKKPVTGGSNAPFKPKTTAPRPTAAPAAKASVSAASKAAPIPKTSRPTVATASRQTTSSTPVRATTTAGKSTALRTKVSAPSAANAASSQPSKFSTTVAAKKDIKTTTSAAARKPLASTITRSVATKASKPEPSKPGTVAKRLHTDTKTSQLKMDETRPVPTRKVPPSPRNVSSHPAPSRMAAEFSNHKQGANSNLVSVKRQTARPMQSVLPLVIKEKPSEEQSSAPVEPSAILETTASVMIATIAPVESVLEAQTTSEELAEPVQLTSALVEGQGDGLQVSVPEPTNMVTVSTVSAAAEPLAVQSVANVPVMSNPSTVVSESEQVHDHVLVVPLMAQEMTEQEPVPASPREVPFTTQVPPKDLEVVDKQEQIIRNLEEEEEEEREGSQQVSVSDMSGTQPTEESRPGSAGLAGSVWRAGGLPSELDSEDVSCSQQGASELSAPGVLEGTESMDDLGEASLKGADGEGASAGSPDFEKFPDIPVNEYDDDEDDDEDEDRVDDMEVGSEMTEDPHRQCNDNEEEDEDVEMASEGVTESGLESYGNADEDDFAEDYRLDNLNRMQPSTIVPFALSAANPFGDAWMQSLQPEPNLVSSPSSSPWQTCTELPNQLAAQACLDIGSGKTDLSSPQSPAVMSPVPSSPLPSSDPAAEMDLGLKQGFASQHISQSRTLLGAELAIHTCSDASTPEELKDYNISPGIENQKQPLPVSPFPVALPDIMQDQGICRSDRAGSEHEEEEPETLPADDMLVCLSTVMTSAPSSHLSATGDEASDTEGDMQISDPTEPGSTGNECFGSTQVVQSTALVEECEEACVEREGGGGSDTPQSATSAASYGYECTTSNSNAQSTTESCIKSPGIFSLENEEQLPDEAKDPSLIRELNLAPAGAPADADHLDQQGELQLNSEQQYMLCGKVTELPEPCSPRGTVPTETGLHSSSSSEDRKDLDLDAPQPYYSTICEKTDSFLTGSDLCAQQQEKLPTVHTRPSKHHSGLRVDHVIRLPVDLPPRMPNVGCNAQLRRLEQHQQQLEELEQRREQQSQRAERQMEEEEVEKKTQVEGELEQRNRGEKEREMEEQRRNLLHLQIQQQQQELKERQQIMQWQEELEQQKQQSKHQNCQQKNLTTVLVSPSALCTIYEAVETSDAEEDFEDQMEEKEMVLKIKVEHECSLKKRLGIPEAGSLSDNQGSPQSQSTSPNLIQDQEGITCSVALGSSPLSSSSSPQQPSLELDWSKKADIVQQLINQTLLLNGDNCSPLLLLPGGVAGTLSPLETSLWPNLPPLTPPSATVTSVSSFSAEISSSSPQGEWTVVELETHH